MPGTTDHCSSKGNRVFKQAGNPQSFTKLLDYMSTVTLVIPRDKQAIVSQPLTLPIADDYFTFTFKPLAHS